MSTSSLLRRISLLLLAIAAAVVAALLSCGGDKPVQPKLQKPDIVSFTASDNDIVPGDSVLFSYSVLRADSVVLTPPGQKLSPATDGSLYIKPSKVAVYTLKAYNEAGQDSARVTVAMSGAVPVITAFTANDDTIAVADSTNLSWTAIRADSLKIIGVSKVSTPLGGSVRVAPATSRDYTAIAYNTYGADTATASVRVEIPAAIQPVNGLYYKGTMGSSVLDHQLQFRVVDINAAPLYKVWMKFTLLEGDGVLSADSLQAGPGGVASVTYQFSDSLGHAVIRAIVPGYDTVDVILRADIIIPGTDFQGQYVKRGDTYATVRGFNGAAPRVDPVTDLGLQIGVWEAALGLVVIFEDNNLNDQLDDADPVNDQYIDSTGIILNTVYQGTTREGIGIGSQMWQIRNSYGSPDFAINDPADTLAVYYLNKGLIFYCGTNPTTTHDTVVAEIHLRTPQ